MTLPSTARYILGPLMRSEETGRFHDGQLMPFCTYAGFVTSARRHETRRLSDSYYCQHCRHGDDLVLADFLHLWRRILQHNKT
jgi:hypothetical protein